MKRCEKCNKPFQDNTKSGNKKFCSLSCEHSTNNKQYFLRNRIRVMDEQSEYRKKWHHMVYSTVKGLMEFKTKAKLQTDKDGYRLYYYAGNKVPEHRIVFALHYNVSLNDIQGFDIHHLDRNRMNNKVENLKAMSKAEHAKLHRSKGVDAI